MDSHYISSGRPPPETPTVRGDLDTPNVLTSTMLTLVSGEGRNLEGGPNDPNDPNNPMVSQVTVMVLQVTVMVLQVTVMV
jgi:hypothetical protein